MTPAVRLHISPLSRELLPTLLAPSVLSVASDISFHTIETFPENNYGFVSLPPMEAQKLKKKLDGSLFKGKKIKIREATGKKEIVPGSENEPQPTEPKRSARAGKRKREDGVIDGIELPNGRKIKRGWAEPQELRRDRSKKKDEIKTKKVRQKSEYTNKPEVLFKTKLPENVKKNVKVSKKKKEAKGKDGGITVVHEFEHTTKHPSFLRTGGTAKGKNEAAKTATSMASRPLKRYKMGSDGKSDTSSDESSSNTEDYDTSSDEASESPPEASDNEKMRVGRQATKTTVPAIREESGSGSEAHARPVQMATDEEDVTSSSGTSSSDSSTDDEEKKVESVQKPDVIATETTPHPLESIFKRPASSPKPDTKTATNLTIDPVPFSFFEPDEDEAKPASATEASTPTTASTPGTAGGLPSRRATRPLSLAIPQTPHTAQDYHVRGQRSAAPTPDTAAPDKTKFKDWFWENRGDNNRAWKKRRREAKKEERQTKSKSRK
jgi:hypothetical protein